MAGSFFYPVKKRNPICSLLYFATKRLNNA